MLNDKVNDRTARAATQTVKKVLLRSDHEGRRVVLVEGAMANQVFGAVGLQFDVLGARQRSEVHLALEALKFFVWDAGHELGL